MGQSWTADLARGTQRNQANWRVVEFWSETDASRLWWGPPGRLTNTAPPHLSRHWRAPVGTASPATTPGFPVRLTTAVHTN
jgi:hypothetical protein